MSTFINDIPIHSNIIKELNVPILNANHKWNIDSGKNIYNTIKIDGYEPSEIFGYYLMNRAKLSSSRIMISIFAKYPEFIIYPPDFEWTTEDLVYFMKVSSNEAIIENFSKLAMEIRQRSKYNCILSCSNNLAIIHCDPKYYRIIDFITYLCNISTRKLREIPPFKFENNCLKFKDGILQGETYTDFPDTQLIYTSSPDQLHTNHKVVKKEMAFKTSEFKNASMSFDGLVYVSPKSGFMPPHTNGFGYTTFGEYTSPYRWDVLNNRYQQCKSVNRRVITNNNGYINAGCRWLHLLEDVKECAIEAPQLITHLRINKAPFDLSQFTALEVLDIKIYDLDDDYTISNPNVSELFIDIENAITGIIKINMPKLKDVYCIGNCEMEFLFEGAFINVAKK